MQTYINIDGVEVAWTSAELELLNHIRSNIGNYCQDIYFIGWIHAALRSENPMAYLNNNMSSIAINAIATDLSYLNG